ncbi:MAG: group I intron-associated PD-(D/E)XK endonuclease [Terriglobales bacterium]
MPRRLDRKHQGDVAELAFMHRAVDLGFKVSRPWGENNRYDFIVDSDGRLIRVQVKSAAVAQRGSYRVGASSGHRRKQPYTKTQIDVLAVHIIPEDAWYLIPVRALAARKTIRLYPRRRPCHPLERFREAWSLLRRKATTKLPLIYTDEH